MDYPRYDTTPRHLQGASQEPTLAAAPSNERAPRLLTRTASGKAQEIRFEGKQGKARYSRKEASYEPTAYEEVLLHKYNRAEEEDNQADEPGSSRYDSSVKISDLLTFLDFRKEFFTTKTQWQAFIAHLFFVLIMLSYCFSVRRVVHEFTVESTLNDVFIEEEFIPDDTSNMRKTFKDIGNCTALTRK